MNRSRVAPAGAKELDYWWTVLTTDPVAVPLVRLFATRGWPSPDQATLIALLLGISTGIAFSFGTRLSLITGAVLFYLAFVFDCVDGKLARALGTTSERGEALDRLADGGRRASASLGLTVSLWRGGRPAEMLWAVVYVVLAYLFIEISGARKSQPQLPVASRWGAALARRRLLPNPGMPDVQAVVFVIGPLTGLVVPALAVGIIMVSAGILLSVRRRLRGAGPGQARSESRP